jgi:hypothetical protein
MEPANIKASPWSDGPIHVEKALKCPSWAKVFTKNSIFYRYGASFVPTLVLTCTIVYLMLSMQILSHDKKVFQICHSYSHMLLGMSPSRESLSRHSISLCAMIMAFSIVKIFLAMAAMSSTEGKGPSLFGFGPVHAVVASVLGEFHVV